MKQLYTLLLLALCLPGLAQTLDSADLARPGQYVVMIGATSIPLSAGDSGTARTWNFASLIPDGRDTLRFQSTSTLPAGYPLIAGENMVIGNAPPQVVMRRVTGANQGIWVSGYGLPAGTNPFDPGPLNFRFNTPLSVVRIPGNYGGQWTETVNGKFAFPFDTTITVPPLTQPINVDSVRVTITIRQLSRFNGTGTLTTPLESVPALRQAIDQQISFGIEVYALVSIFPGLPSVGTWISVPVQLPSQNLYTVNYWAKNRAYPVVTMELDSLRRPAGFSYQDPAVFVSTRAQLSRGAYQLYPNPVPVGQPWQLRSPEGTRPAQLRIATSNGRLVPVTQGTLPMLPRGVYVVYPDQSLPLKLVVE